MDPLTQTITETVVSEITKPVLDSIWGQIGYVLKYSSNIQNLEKKIKKLTDAKQRVEHAVNEAWQNPLEEIEEDVKAWLKRVDNVIKEAGEIPVKDNEEAKKRCFIGLCPNLKTRYLVSKKAMKECNVIAQVQAEGKFDRVSYRVTIQGMGPVKDYEAFESRRIVSDTIMELLKGADVRLIGVYGMGGIGKTMLLNKIVEQVKADGIFKVVVQATADQIVDVKKMQEEIAEWLGFKFEVESVPVRANHLCERLKREEKFLVVLDNIWTRINLEDIGIPFWKDHKGGKILMSSRSQNVLLEMGAQRNFRLEVLEKAEAWHLFEKNAGVVGPDKKETAMQVATRCAGLPILIETVAKGLKDKELHEWENALEDLKRCDDKGMEAQVFSALELSYNFLGDEEKDLFLLCGQLLPYNISISSLLKYVIGLDFFEKRNTVKAARNKLLTVVDNLKRSCFLLEGDDRECVKMHEVIHSFAITVGSKKSHIITVESDSGFNEWREDIFKQCTAVFLFNCEIPKLPEAQECPHLKSFILHAKEPSTKIPDGVFLLMKELKVLDLTGMDLSLLPSSMQSLQNLQTLCVDKCTLGDISAIGELKKLQVLSFCGSSIAQLPKEVGQLARLKFLDLSHCSSLNVIPPNVLSRLLQLEDLYIEDSFVDWKKEGKSSADDNASLAELKLLTNINTLHLQIVDATMMPKDLFSEKLERFKVFFGDEWDWSGTYQTSKTLKLKLNSRIHMERFKVLLMKAEDLHLNDLKGVQNVLYELDVYGFPQLKHLHVQNSLEIQYIIDSIAMGSHDAFPKLESLFLDYLINLDKICHGTLQTGAFGSLRKLNVRNCNKLKNLFTFSMARNLAQLQEIDVNSCRVMEEIIAEEHEDLTNKNTTIMLTKLGALKLENLPRFGGFCSPTKASGNMQNARAKDVGPSEIVAEDDPNAESVLFVSKVEFPNLVDLKLSSINVEKIWPTQLKELSQCIQNLTSLTVEGCWNLRYMFTSSMVESLAQLKKLEIGNCNLIEEIIVTQGLEDVVVMKNFFPKLDSLKLKSLPKFRSFCIGDSIEFPLLKVLWVEHCPYLQSFISSYTSTDGARQVNSTLFDEKVSFPNLEELHILHMHKLRRIWENEEQDNSFGILKVLKVRHAKKLLNMFPSNMWKRLRTLETLVVKDCDLLEEVFDLQGLMQVKERLTLALRNLDILNLPMLKRVWNGDPNGILFPRNLRSVCAWDCPNLKSLFPASVAKGLVQLEDLNLDDCGMEELIAKEGLETSPTFIFPKLKSLQLWRLHELRNFYPGDYTLDCPVLEELSVYHCEKLEFFGSESPNLQETCIKSEPLISFTELVPNLKSMTLSHKEIEIIKQGPLPPDLFNKLEVLDLQCFHHQSSSFPFDLLHKFQNLRTLSVACSKFEELFPPGFVVHDKNVNILAQIQHLELDYLTNLRRIWNQESHHRQVLQNLQQLEVNRCNELITLAPSSASFQNLTTLDVVECDGLINFLTSTTAKSLVKLTTMVVKGCKMLTEIITDEGEKGQTDEITLTKLESLRLHCLKSLSRFSLTTSIIKFPSLTEVIVTQCPNMKFFSQGDLYTPKLKKVCVTKERDRWSWVGDLKTTIYQLYRDMDGFNGMQHLKLSEFPQLKEKWHGQLPVNFFFNLRSLVVDDCAFHSVAIPSNLLPFLNALEELEIRNCHLVEDLFDLQWPNAEKLVGYLSNLKEFQLTDLPQLRHLWGEVPKGILDFKSLTLLKIHNCRSLKNVFTLSMCLGLVQLKKLEVRSCPMVEEIITGGEAKYDLKIILPVLDFVVFEYLPNLTSFYSGTASMECPNLKEIMIVGCPRLNTTYEIRQLKNSKDQEPMSTDI